MYNQLELDLETEEVTEEKDKQNNREETYVQMSIYDLLEDN